MAYQLDAGRSLHPRLTPTENLQYLAALRGVKWKSIEERYQELGRRFEISQFFSTQMQRLSRGTQQKFSLISAISSKARLWLLDEPTLALDEGSVEVLTQLLHEHLAADGTVLMATHDAVWAGAFSRLLYMSDVLRLSRALVAAEGGQEPNSADSISLPRQNNREYI